MGIRYQTRMPALLLANAASSVAPSPASAPARKILIEAPAGVLAVLLAVLALIFWLSQHRVFGKIFKVVPLLLFCCFVPTALTTAKVIPADSPLYEWVKNLVLRAGHVRRAGLHGAAQGGGGRR